MLHTRMSDRGQKPDRESCRGEQWTQVSKDGRADQEDGGKATVSPREQTYTKYKGKITKQKLGADIATNMKGHIFLL